MKGSCLRQERHRQAIRTASEFWEIGMLRDKPCFKAKRVMRGLDLRRNPLQAAHPLACRHGKRKAWLRSIFADGPKPEG